MRGTPAGAAAAPVARAVDLMKGLEETPERVGREAADLLAQLVREAAREALPVRERKAQRCHQRLVVLVLGIRIGRRLRGKLLGHHAPRLDWSGLERIRLE